MREALNRRCTERRHFCGCVCVGGAGIPTLSLQPGYLKSSGAMMVVQSWTGDTMSYEAASHTFAWAKGVKGQCGLRPGGGGEEVP